MMEINCPFPSFFASIWAQRSASKKALLFFSYFFHGVTFSAVDLRRRPPTVVIFVVLTALRGFWPLSVPVSSLGDKSLPPLFLYSSSFHPLKERRVHAFPSYVLLPPFFLPSPSQEETVPMHFFGHFFFSNPTRVAPLSPPQETRVSLQGFLQRSTRASLLLYSLLLIQADRSLRSRSSRLILRRSSQALFFSSPFYISPA